MATMAVQVRHRSSRMRFVVAIMTGSFLLFLVQPMIARMALPRLGGAPAVWNSAMLVYQALLLAGYAYAHALGRLSARAQAITHIVVLASASLMLPIGLVAMTPSPTANPIVWTPWLLALSIGPLFFAIAAQAPLLQRWFALSDGGDPYPLYAASNLGSFGGLIAYPLIVEPLLPLQGQSLLWSAGYVVVAVLVAACALALPKHQIAAGEVIARTPLTPRQVMWWITLAAVPSGLMLSTTTYLTTDIVAMPLLWVIPLGLYLLSFSIAFSDRRGPARVIVHAAPYVLIAGGGVAFAQNPHYPWLFAPLGLLLLFVMSVTLHTALFERRPDPSRLTAFYLAMSVGGVVGGAFCALLAPLIFDWAYEHPVLIMAAAALITTRPLFGFAHRLWAMPGRWPLLIGLGAIVLSMAVEGLFAALPTPVPLWARIAGVIVLIDLTLFSLGNRTAFVLTLGALMMSVGGWTTVAASIDGGHRVRSYFGIYSFGYQPGPMRYLVHGTTVHGLQDLRAGHENRPLSYYAPDSGVGLALRDLAAHKPDARVGIVGLGTGTLACYATPQADWRFYEIDPAMVRIARDPKQFSFLARCKPGVPVELGDARLTLDHESGPPLDLLVVDAFSSDSIPMHLLTREAFGVYGRRLVPAGILLVHISNRFLRLEPVVAAMERVGWHSAIRNYSAGAEGGKLGYSDSHWIMLSRDPRALDGLIARTGPEKWGSVRQQPGFSGWTDDYASILPLIKWTVVK